MGPTIPLRKKVLVLFFLLSVSSDLVTSSSFYFWNEKLLYIPPRLMKLQDAIDYCSKLGGTLPTIHSRQEKEQIQMTTGSLRIWLGAKPKYRDDKYEWMDGTPFNYSDWDRSTCNAFCCGVLLRATRTIDNYRMSKTPCDTNASVACLMPFLNPSTMDDWLKTHSDSMSLLNETLDEIMQVRRSIGRFSQNIGRLGKLESRTSALSTRTNVLIFAFSAFLVVMVVVLVYQNFEKVTGLFGSLRSGIGSVSFRRFT